jgi:transposase-like protein
MTGDEPGEGGKTGPGGERQVPFFCPYCGEEELRPSGSQPGSWDCHSCARSFQLRFTGLVSA